MANAGNIRAWLAELGLAKYAEVFSSNAIDLDVVRELTDADLKDLGVEAMGDRKRLLRAIASLTTERMSSVAGAATEPSPTDAERRQVTVMFSDLDASTALAARMDPEDQ
jgi:class 3 adenylate cyclase